MVSRDATRTTAARPRIDRSAPGHWKPRPSPTQKPPKLASRTPTENFSVFSGILANGRRTASAARATTMAAPAAPRLAGTIM